MKALRLPLRVQYAVITCGLVALSLVTVTVGWFGFYFWYDEVARRELPASVQAELQALESEAGIDDERWDVIYEQYQLWPSLPLQVAVLTGIGLIVFAMTGTVGFLLAQRFGRPITAVALAARRVARGDLTARAEVPLPGNPELATLVADFNQMADHLERAEGERRMTTAAIAHELRTPLTVMRGRLQGMLDGVFETNRGEVTRLVAQTDLLARIVEDLRTVTLAEAGRLDLRWETLELRALAAECIEIMGPRLTNSGLRAEVHGEAVSIRADRDRLMQALCAFLDNAVRYAPNTGVVDITVIREESVASVAVADRGPGLPEGGTELAFQGFWRADESRSRALGGSGLGLAVVQAIAFAHGAQARATNRTGGGSIFEIRFPLNETQVETG